MRKKANLGKQSEVQGHKEPSPIKTIAMAPNRTIRAKGTKDAKTLGQESLSLELN